MKDFTGMIEQAVCKAKKDIGKFNIIIVGRTGVGKSTLINEIFQGRIAATGQGKPVTKETRLYTKKGIPLAIYDTRGLELKENRQIIDKLMDLVSSKAAETDPYRHIHVAWLCISEDGRRVEGAEIELHKRLAEFMPVLGVITKHRTDKWIQGRGSKAFAQGYERGFGPRVARSLRWFRCGVATKGAGRSSECHGGSHPRSGS